MTDRIISLIKAYVEPGRHHLLDDPTTTMHELRLGVDVLNALSVDIEDEFHITLVDEKDGWDCVGNVVATVGKVRV